MKSSRKVGFLIIFAVLSVIAVSVLGIAINDDFAYAAELRESELQVVQAGKIYYSAEDYLENEEYRARLISILSVKLDGQIEEANIDNVNIICSEKMINPKQYRCSIEFIKDDKIHKTENVIIEIDKRPVQVITLLNGKTNIAINEGESVSIVYDYVGAVESDTHLSAKNGVQFREINEDKLTRPAYVPSVPTFPTTNYTIVADYAESPYYSFTYPRSLLTINERMISTLTEKSGDMVLVSLTGQFNITYSLDFKNIGVNSQNKEYAEIYADIEKNYGAGDLLDKNEVVACYKINVTKDGVLPQNNISAYTKVKVAEEVKGYKSYSIIAFYNNGNTEVLKATMGSDDYLIFEPVDMGNFVVVAPITEISASTYIFAIVGGIAAVLIVVLLVAVFRRKY